MRFLLLCLGVGWYVCSLRPKTRIQRLPLFGGLLEEWEIVYIVSFDGGGGGVPMSRFYFKKQ